MTDTQQQTREDVLARIRPYVEAAHVEDTSGTISLQIDLSYVLQRTYACHIGIIPSQDPDRDWRLNEELARIAVDIAEQEGIEIHFIPRDAPKKQTTKTKETIAA
jgi:hypothetical protein